jgi:hypothetical protein
MKNILEADDETDDEATIVPLSRGESKISTLAYLVQDAVRLFGWNEWKHTYLALGWVCDYPTVDPKYVGKENVMFYVKNEAFFYPKRGKLFRDVYPTQAKKEKMCGCIWNSMIRETLSIGHQEVYTREIVVDFMTYCQKCQLQRKIDQGFKVTAFDKQFAFPSMSDRDYQLMKTQIEAYEGIFMKAGCSSLAPNSHLVPYGDQPEEAYLSEHLAASGGVMDSIDIRIGRN